MENLLFERYAVTSPALQPWVKFIWRLESQEGLTINNKLLPTDSIDIVLSIQDEIEYLIEGKLIKAGSVHFNGMRNKHRFIIQKGISDVFGISFFPYGLYPFSQRRGLSSFNSRIVDLKECNSELSEKLLAALKTHGSIHDIVLQIEEALLSELDLSRINMKHIELIKMFSTNNYEIPVGLFCMENRIRIKTFERACQKYTGYTPKILQRIGRFQAAGNSLIYNKESNFADASNAEDYYDQSHFIKEFKTYSGVSPTQFIDEKITIKQNSTVISK